MNQKPEPKRGMPRSLIYVFVPLGFVLLVVILVLGGFWTQETTEEPASVVDEEPAALDQ